MNKPTGFIAICRCKNVIGALDYRTNPADEVGKLLGVWLMNGCTIQPMFGHTWSVKISPCECEDGQSGRMNHV